MADKSAGITAEETPALRRALAEHMRGDGAATMYALMIAVGRQPIRPPGPADQVGLALAQTEAARLEHADLWHVDADMAELVDAAYPLMPPFAPRAYDLPSRHGFATFARPLTALVRDAIPADRAAAEQQARDHPTAANELLLSQADDPVMIVAVSWGPSTESAMGASDATRRPNPWRERPGVWMSFWSTPFHHQERALLDALSPDERAAYRSMSAPLNVDNECMLAWCPDGADEQGYLIGPGSSYRGTAAWAAALLATFALARQGNVAVQNSQPVPRAERRRHVRAGLPEPRTVRVLRLRHGVGNAARVSGDEPGRVYRHRWVVRAHWRNQWYPSIGAHRPKWIAPYLAGPEDAPLLGGDKVTRVSAPTGEGAR